MTEQVAVHQSVQERQLSPSTSSSPATMMWPLLLPLLFTTEGYFSCAFPTLFPTGAGVTGGRGKFAVVNRGWAGTVPDTWAGRRQSIAMGGQSIGSEVAAAVTHNPVP